jgi:hypothetical protein
MSEEKKTKEKTFDLTGESFKLSSAAMSQGYNAKIDGRHFVIDFAKDYRKRRLSQFASVCEIQETPEGNVFQPISPAVYSLKGLTPLQFKELTIARIIELNKEQAIEFKKMFFTAKARG